MLVLGGGDGLALREVLRYPHVEHVTLVDLDPEMTRLFCDAPRAAAAQSAARSTIRACASSTPTRSSGSTRPTELFDFAVVDFPDPSNFSLGKLYTTAFYRLLARHLTPDGTFVVQSTSPLFARQSFWCIVATVEQAGLAVAPYHVYVPSFGEWGFVLAGQRPGHASPTTLPAGLRFLTAARSCRSCSTFRRHGTRVDASRIG